MGLLLARLLLVAVYVLAVTVFTAGAVFGEIVAWRILGQGGWMVPAAVAVGLWVPVMPALFVAAGVKGLVGVVDEWRGPY